MPGLGVEFLTTGRVRWACAVLLASLTVFGIAVPASATPHWFGGTVMSPAADFNDDGGRVSMVDASRGWAVKGQGIFATTDGVTWVKQFDYFAFSGWGNTFVGLAALSPSSCVAFVEESPPMYTVDGGAHWSQASSEFNPLVSRYYCSVAAVGSRVWVGGRYGIFVSDDGGRTWLMQPDITGNVTGIAFGDATHGWAYVNDYPDSYLYRTTDGGDHWALATLQPGCPVGSLYFLDNLHGWFTGGGGWTSSRRSYRTTDGGVHWSRLPVDEVFSGSDAVYTDPLHGWSPVNATRTSDGGVTWVEQWNQFPADHQPSRESTSKVTDICFTDPLNGWVVLQDGSIFHTVDGGGPDPKPKATVYTPHAGSTMYRNHHYTIYGYVKPKHTSGTYLVQLNFYLKNSHGTYVYHSHVHAKRYYYSSTMTKYKATVSLPHKGRWRVRAYHSDSGHSPSFSGYDYITVK